jgi:hypothetical protein
MTGILCPSKARLSGPQYYPMAVNPTFILNHITKIYADAKFQTVVFGQLNIFYAAC